MSKPYAKQFYNSRDWVACRDAYLSERMKIDGGMCERCRKEAGREVHHKIVLNPDNIHDPSVALNHENLQLLCRDCHFAVHREMILQSFKQRATKRILDDRGMYFDEAGQIRPMDVIIVTGAPGSGKTAYIEAHRIPTDLVIDLDRMESAFGVDVADGTANNLLALSLAVREYLYQLVEERSKLIDCQHVWIAATLPRRKERNELIKRLRAKHIHMPTSSAECRKRILSDKTRKNQQVHVAIMERYFENYEPG